MQQGYLKKGQAGASNWQSSGAALFLWGIVLVIAAAGMLPLFSMLFHSVYVDGRLTLAAFEGLLGSKRQWILLFNSLGLAASVSVFATISGVPLGILFGKSDLPLKRPLALIFVVPLLIPPYILAVAWSDLFGTGNSMLNFLSPQVLNAMHGLLFGFGGTLLVLGTIHMSIPMLLTMAFLNTIDPGLEEAARMTAPWPRVLRHITMPLIMPGILFSALLVFILALGEFSVASFLRFEVFSVESFTRFSASYDFRSATALSIPLAVITVLILLLESAFLHKKTYTIAPFSARGRGCTIALGRFRPVAFFLAAAAAFMLVILPLLGLLALPRGLNVYLEALLRAGDSLTRSLVYAFSGACLLTFLGFFMGYLVHKRAIKWWNVADKMCLFLFAIPGTVLGIGLISLWNRPGVPLIYGTFSIILIGYIAKYSALPGRIMLAQFMQIPSSLEEAAQICGAGWPRRIALILVPLAGNGLVAAWLVAFLFCLRDTDITMLLYPPGCETLPVRIFTLMANGAPDLIAALCVIMVCAAVLPASILTALWGKGGKGV